METIELKERFIELRAKGWSFDKIAREIGKAKQTLIDWSKDLQDEIANRKATELEALYETYFLLKEAKIKKFGAILSKITNELENRDFNKIPTGRLLELYLLYFERLSQEVIEPSFKSSIEINEDRQDRELLEALITLKDEPVRRLKVG